MQTILTVEDMHCAHCVQSITTALMELSGVESVTADLEAHTVTIEHNNSVAKTTLAEAIEGQGFTVS